MSKSECLSKETISLATVGGVEYLVACVPFIRYEKDSPMIAPSTFNCLQAANASAHVEKSPGTAFVVSVSLTVTEARFLVSSETVSTFGKNFFTL